MRYSKAAILSALGMKRTQTLATHKQTLRAVVAKEIQDSLEEIARRKELVAYLRKHHEFPDLHWNKRFNEPNTESIDAAIERIKLAAGDIIVMTENEFRRLGI